METIQSPTEATRKCMSCGGTLRYKSGNQVLFCNFCHAEQVIQVATDTPLEESDYLVTLARLADTAAKKRLHTVTCLTCQAVVTMKPNVVADSCPYCGKDIILKNATYCTVLRPDYVLPFGIDLKTAKNAYASWLTSLWFAPTRVKRLKYQSEKLQGVYMPFWTYDATVYCRYRGQRGFTRYECIDLGQSKGNLSTLRIPRTSWKATQGSISLSFDDVVVPASKSLPKRLIRKLTRWNLKKLVGYRDDYLIGYRAEAYALGLEEGFEAAKQQMENQIEQAIKAHIGGDRQMIVSKAPRYQSIRFKHILLPLWISSYRYQGRIYRFAINAQTGQISGERPFSVLKITGAVLLGILLITLILGIAHILAV